jgi:thioredoxin 1
VDIDRDVCYAVVDSVHNERSRSNSSLDRRARRVGNPELRGDDPMTPTTPRVDTEPARADVDALPGATLLEFGAAWCGVCRSTQPAIAGALAKHPDVRHVKVEDASGRPLGRSFGIKLWPTLVFLCDGREIDRLVRPRGEAVIEGALQRLAAAGCVAGDLPSIPKPG